jgi:L-iditol 2-dehydrogenase
MKVAVYHSNSDVRVEERDKPEINDGEILIKVRASGICGSDVMEWYRKKKAPLVPGHEVSGEIVGVGKNVSRYKPGDRVSVVHKVPCNTCHHCLNDHHSSCDTSRSTTFYPGGFSEYIRVPEINVDRGVFILPDGMTFEEGTFLEPLSCAVRAQRIMNMSPGESVLVMGCGIAGMLNIRLALASGAGKVLATDISEYRLEKAEKSGAFPINAKEDVASVLRERNSGLLADNVIVCTGAKPAALQSFSSVERGGKIMFFAVPRPDEEVVVPLNDFWTNEIKIMTSYYTSPKDIETARTMIASGRVRVDDLVTHRFSLDDIQKGFDVASEAGNSLKVIIIPESA